MNRSLPLLSLVVVACSSTGEPSERTGVVTTVAGTGLAAFTGDGELATESPLYAPIKVGIAGERRLIIDWNNHRVRELLSNGTLLTVVGTGVESPGMANVVSIAFAVHHPFDVESTASGELYFAGFHDPRVFKVDNTQRVRMIAGSGAVGNWGDGMDAQVALMNSPSGVAVAADGSVYICESLNHVIRRVRSDGVLERIAGTGERGYSGDGGPALSARLDGPTRIEIAADGALVFADTINHVIRRIDRNGIISTIAGKGGVAGNAGDGGPAFEALLDEPLDLALLPDGEMLIADSKNHRIRSVDLDGTITTIAGTSTSGFAGDGGSPLEAAFNTPSGLTVDAEGSVWIADTGNHRIRRIDYSDK